MSTKRKGPLRSCRTDKERALVHKNLETRDLDHFQVIKQLRQIAQRLTAVQAKAVKATTLPQALTAVAAVSIGQIVVSHTQDDRRNNDFIKGQLSDRYIRMVQAAVQQHLTLTQVVPLFGTGYLTLAHQGGGVQGRQTLDHTLTSAQ